MLIEYGLGSDSTDVQENAARAVAYAIEQVCAMNLCVYVCVFIHIQICMYAYAIEQVCAMNVCVYVHMHMYT